MATTKSGHPARWVCVLLALSILAGLAACQPASKPAITSLSPTSGTVGTSVTIRGSRLNGVSAVRFNVKSATVSFEVPPPVPPTGTGRVALQANEFAGA